MGKPTGGKKTKRGTISGKTAKEKRERRTQERRNEDRRMKGRHKCLTGNDREKLCNAALGKLRHGGSGTQTETRAKVGSRPPTATQLEIEYHSTWERNTNSTDIRAPNAVRERRGDKGSTLSPSIHPWEVRDK